MNTFYMNLRAILTAGLLTFLLGTSQMSHAALALPDAPLILGTGPQPNIFFGLDDSGSMDWEVVIEGTGNGTLFLTHSALGTSTGHFYLFPVADRNLDPFGFRDRTTPSIEFFERCAAELRAQYSNAGNFFSAVDGKTACADELRIAWRAYNNNFNGLYYNPEVTYTPWKGNDTSGTAYGAASPTAARVDPFNASLGTVDLTTTLSDYVSWWNGRKWNNFPSWEDQIDGFRPSFYYAWIDVNGNSIVDPTPTDTAIRVDIVPTTPTYNNDGAGTDRSARVDCAAAPVCTYAEEIQNFANWFQYYRKREFVLKKAVSELIDSSSARMGLATLNRNNSVARPVSSMVGIGDLASGVPNKTELLKQLSRINSSGGTPNRILLADIGRYFDQSNSTNSSIGFSSFNSSPILSAEEGGECQQNFTVFMTDGFWNGGSRGFGNEDGDDNTPWDGGPHADNASDTLADVAMFYYENDLAPGLDNLVPTIEGVDENPTQHMVTYGVAFGLTGNNLTTPPNSDSSTPPPPWPASVSADSAEALDDLQHAAFNGRGLFLNAQKSDELIDSLQDAVADIQQRASFSASAVAFNSTSLREGSLLFQARFDSSDFSGELTAFSLNPDATFDQELWRATENFPAVADRDIFTMVDKAGTPTAIEFLNTDTDLVTAVGSAAIIDYIRGDQSGEEQNGGTFRDRNVLLGDIVNSSPLSAGFVDFFNDLLPGTEGDTYSAFRTDKFNRFTDINGDLFSVVYVGSNDGMLHAFDSKDGGEIFAYIPSVVHGNLNLLTDPDYGHKFFVNGSPSFGDAFINGAWRTMLVGALGSGGRAVYALDITNPFNFSAGNVMWEFTSADNNELGFVFHNPQLARLENGKWGVIFGNGFNSNSETAQLFILDAEDGSVIKIIDTEAGGPADSNGLSEPLLVDTNGNLSVDTVYAGDLQGNLWKFDISNSNTNQWKVAFKQGATPKPLYTALDDNGDPQPITTKPTITVHPKGGFVVLFGTGKLIENSDNIIPANPQVETFYGIRDNETEVGSGRNNLEEQLILAEIDVLDSSNNVIGTTRVTTDTTVDYATKNGWFIDLVSPVNGLVSPVNGEEGERVIANPVIRSGRVTFVTFIPPGSPCTAGGTSVLMTLNPVSGNRLENAAFDANNDGIIDASDMVDYNGTPVAPSGLFIPGTIAGTGMITTGQGDDIAVTTDVNQDGDDNGGGGGGVTRVMMLGDTVTFGRQSWRQLR